MPKSSKYKQLGICSGEDPLGCGERGQRKDYREPEREKEEREEGEGRKEGGREKRGRETDRGRKRKRRVEEKGEVPIIPFEDEPSASTRLYFRNSSLPTGTTSLASEDRQTASNQAAADFCGNPARGPQDPLRGGQMREFPLRV